MIIIGMRWAAPAVTYRSNVAEPESGRRHGAPISRRRAARGRAVSRARSTAGLTMAFIGAAAQARPICDAGACYA